MISTRIAAAIAAAVLVVGLLVGAAGSVLLDRSGASAPGSWASGSYGRMGGSYGYGMMGNGSWSYDDMLNEMREHMDWPEASPQASEGAAQ